MLSRQSIIYVITIVIYLTNSACIKRSGRYEASLADTLTEIYHSDQGIRARYFDTADEFGWHADTTIKIGQIMWHQDSLNLLFVDSLLHARGWLGKEVIGQRGNQTLFLVIQHANDSIRARYLPLMRDAVKKGNAQIRDLALLEDRVALAQGRKQVYGSQIESDEKGHTFVAPMIEPDQVDKRRKAVGLNSMSENLKRFNMKWDAETYKKMLPQYEVWMEEMRSRQ